MSIAPASKERSPLQLQAALCNFDKSNLKRTETRVMTMDGRIVCESRSSHGRVKTTELAPGLGYVGDAQLDLQVAEVLPGLIMGSQDLAHSLDILESYHVTQILNVATLVENIFSEKFMYKNIEIYDIPETNITKHFEGAFEFINRTVGAESACTLVHCNAGVSRSATIVIAFLMKLKNMRFSEAFEYLKYKRPSIRPNTGFLSQLKQYDQLLWPDN